MSEGRPKPTHPAGGGVVDPSENKGDKEELEDGKEEKGDSKED